MDHRPYGGTCMLRGCDPKKVLVGVAETIHRARRMRGKGPEGELRLDWPALMAFKESFTDQVAERQRERHRARGIATYHGRARFSGPNTLDLAGTEVEAKRFVIAAGAEPVPLRIAGAEHLITSETFLELETLPERIAFVGGGYIAAEFSHIAARAGAKVTVLQRGPRMLKSFDRDVVDWSMESFRQAGIDVHVQTTVHGVERMSRGFRVHATRSGAEMSVEADLVVHAAGRAPPLDSLDLEQADVATFHGRIDLNEYLQSTSNPAVYAAGDAAQAGPPLTPVASHDAEVVARNLLQGNRRSPDYRGVPRVAFTVPPLAGVGLTEDAARQGGYTFRTNARRTGDWFTARQRAEPVYAFKVLIEERSGHILGAHVVGPRADEVINLFAIAIRNRLTRDDLQATILAYPTSGSDLHSML